MVILLIQKELVLHDIITDTKRKKDKHGINTYVKRNMYT